MSFYHKYIFISPEPIYATVKEELKSYFDTGAVDDLLFPTYLDKCMKKLGRTTYPIMEVPIFIEDFEARLPDNFYAVREAWMCGVVPLTSYQDANSFYSQSASSTTIQIQPVTIGGVACDTNCNKPTECDPCMPELVQAVYKTNQETARAYKQMYLLKPGNISAKQNCDVSYNNTLDLYGQESINSDFVNPFSSGIDSFDIRDNKFVTNFRKGVVHLIFYATEYDKTGNQLVPDNYRIREYVEAFIKFKVFETLTNQVNDETFNQLQQKMMYHKQLYEEAYIMADIEMKKQTPWEKQRRIKQDLDRFRKYQIAGTRVNGRGRNGNGNPDGNGYGYGR
jgi:hypothetical protein